MRFWFLHPEHGVLGFHRGLCRSGFDDPPRHTSPKTI